jgi:hypothetical protein
MTFEQVVPWMLALAVPALLIGARKLWGEMTEQRLELVDQFITIAYHVTDEVARVTPNKVDDKVAFALGELQRLLRVNRKKPLTEGEAELAKAKWSAMSSLEAKAAGAPPLVALTSAPLETPPQRPSAMPGFQMPR